MYLELKNLNFSYGDKKILQSINFGVDKGEIVGLIGANGAGKTTTICNIVKKLTPQSGEIYIGNRKIEKATVEQLGITYVPDTPVYYEELTVEEHLYFVQALYKNTEVNIGEVIQRLELEEHLNKIPSMLSKGTLQKLLIALSLVRKFNIFIADEPFNGLDPKQISEFKQILRDIKKKDKAILISTHLLDVIDDLCDRYVMINKGKVITFGTKTEIIQKYGLQPDSTIETIYLALINQ